MKLARKFDLHNYRFGEVILIADYYDPIPVVFIRR